MPIRRNLEKRLFQSLWKHLTRAGRGGILEKKVGVGDKASSHCKQQPSVHLSQRTKQKVSSFLIVFHLNRY